MSWLGKLMDANEVPGKNRKSNGKKERNEKKAILEVFRRVKEGRLEGNDRESNYKSNDAYGKEQCRKYVKRRVGESGEN